MSPDTILKFHRFLVKRKYQKLYSNKRRKPGPKGFSKDIVQLVIDIKLANPSYGCPKIAALVTNTTGISISQDTVRRILKRNNISGESIGRGPSWLTFMATSKDRLWSIDLFRAESVKLKTHWVLAVMDVYSRRVIGYAVHAGNSVSGPNLCYMFNQVIAGSQTPKRISRDNDPLYKFHQWTVNMDMLNIEEVFGPSYTPTANPFVERLIGTTRREFLDNTYFWDDVDLRRKLACFADYYNKHRVHEGISGSTPFQISGDREHKTCPASELSWKKCCYGLYKVPIAA